MNSRKRRGKTKGDSGVNRIGKILPFLLISVVFAAPAGAWLHGTGDYTPEVRRAFPKNESTVVLKKQSFITFRWQPTPIPSGHRACYKFELFKDYGYERIVVETLSPRVFSIEIPADKFENNTTYTWQVRQRDEWTRLWSRPTRWNFKVMK